MTRRHAIILLAATLGPRTSAAAVPSSTSERTLMGTRFAITCCHSDKTLIREATTAAFDEAEKINQIASDYIADSELLSISRQPADTAVPISSLLFSLLQQACDYAEKTNGLFDPTIGPLTHLWRESRRRRALPTPEILAKARAATGWRNLILDPERFTATFKLPGMRLDLGGIAKGQAADRMLKILNNYGISSSLVTAGGDVRAGDSPPDEEGWRIGIRHFDKNVSTGILLLSNCGVSTSGDLQQSVEIEGVRYAHIIDPATGLGLTHHVAATVISPTSALSDALDAACCIAPLDEARKLATELGCQLLRDI